MAQNWTQALIGLWLVLSPWLFGFSDITLMKWNNVVVGVILVLVNVWAIFGEKQVINNSQTNAKS